MTGLEIIEKHLGGEFATEEMKKTADDLLGRVGWLMSWNSKRKEIWYECCRHRLEQCDSNTVDEEMALYHAEHRKKGVCPYCGANVYYIKRQHAAQTDYTEVYTVWYRMSQTEPNTLLVLGMWSGRRWYQVKLGRSPEEIQTEHEACSLVMLPWGAKPERHIREVLHGPGSYDSWWWGARAEAGSGGWVKRSRVEGADRQSIRGGGIEYLLCNQLEDVTRGTRWEKPAEFVKCRWHNAYTVDRVRQLQTFCTHTAMEYMLGNGMEGIVRSCIAGDGTLPMIRWKRKKPTEMLGLDSNELARLRRMDPEKVSGLGLIILKYARQYGQRVKLEDAMAIACNSCISSNFASEIKHAAENYGQRLGVMRILRYCSQSYGRLRMWLDYMGELTVLGEAADEARAFPRDLYAAHAETSSRVRYRSDPVTVEKVEKRAEKLAKEFTFEACGLHMEPFTSPQEIIREGTAQNICIGSYVNSYANGRTILLKLRRADQPDVPFHAVEMSTDGRTLVQCRGYANKTYAEDEAAVRGFWAAWDKAHGTINHVYLTINHEREVKTA